MTTQEFINSIPSLKPDAAAEASIKRAYRADNLAADIMAIAASAGRGESLDGGLYCRRLSLTDILEAENDFGVKFAELGLIPLFDKCDNDFIVFDIRSGRWAMFNIVDQTRFAQGETLSKLLN